MEVSLVELMQAKRNEQENISTKDAEQMLADTLRLSKTTDKIVRSIGGMILAGFGIISLLLLLLQITDDGSVWFPVGSIITGLIAWGIPVWKISFARGERGGIDVILSLGFAFLSIVIQFLSIAHEVHTGDWSAIEDTVDALIQVVVLFGAVTLALNIIMVKVSGDKQ